MKKPNTKPQSEFWKTYNAEMKRHQFELETVLENAGDKYFALHEHLNYFVEDYRKDQKAFPNFLPLLQRVERTLKLDKNKTFDQVIANSKEYLEKGEELLVFLGVFKAKYDFSDKLHYMYHHYDESQNEEITVDKASFTFTWSDQFSQRDFAKLFYALKEAGILVGDITKIVPQAAKALHFNLGDGWKANFSKGKNYANSDFSQTKIFDILKESFVKYCNKLNNKQNK